MDGPIPLRGSISIPASELEWRFSRSSGPGGQHVNTSSTAAELRFDLAQTQALPPPLKARALQRLEGRLVQGVLVVRAEEHRSQWRNRAGAREKLREILLQAIAPPPRPRRETKPTKGSRERRLAAKRQRSDVKRGRSWRGDD